MSTNTEKHEFQAEIAQLLDLVVHSLYTDKVIFVRKLISNAVGGCDYASAFRMTFPATSVSRSLRLL